ncbi:uncharacterized protein [Aristolochia californica]|uniref:uncharacterized protein n=1 Tax=Aristolochia californica TaxID=171875 RepID=UPI0035D91B20
MKVHPAPKKRNITFRYDIHSSLSEATEGLSSSSFSVPGRQKKLRRLPHIFSKVLELPFHSDTDVSIEEDHDCLRFIVSTDDVGHDIQVQIIEIYPGVTKIAVRGGNDVEFSLDEFTLDLWRFRLPSSTRPELATADYVDGELIVTVPKGGVEGMWEEGNGDLRDGVGHLVVVQ